ncbi:hypothetical protein [Microseira wollei]|uniref:Uncharacterized protein n=1 Tax=Microseira wollei NIES-4236 TaxID=2530354 RepID=A0AAV3XBA8_9CYAN|nr:hypothetical protein [Microseira wollei]GET38025.1 hypothetical protein MiSe_27790 [Microseira wollei NIES-4236]
MMTTLYYPLLANCSFDKNATLPIILFEAFIFAGVGASFFILRKVKDKIWLRFLVMSVGVLIFELFTSPMWNNYKMGQWAYVYHDVSWILTIGWTSLILSVVLLVDKFLEHWKEWKKFGVDLGILTALIIPLEMIVVNIGVRSYAPEVLQAISGIFILGVPIEVLYYIPVFTGLVIAFYKYWSFVIDDELLIPVKGRKWWRSLLIAFLGVFLFEVMIEPMVRNEKFPQWSYVFHDISIILIAAWVLIIGVAAVAIARFFIHYPIIQRFGIALMITSALVWPLESWLIINGYRVYGETAVKSYIGFKTPITNLPVEITFAIPFYMALIIAFIRYWETTLDNRL